MLFQKTVLFLWLLGILSLTLAQQVFETKGNNYHAKVLIHRKQGTGGYQPPMKLPANSKQANRPWKQGDRITKQEVVQNLARALLTQRKSPSERQTEQRKKEAEAHQKYTMAHAKLAKTRLSHRAPHHLQQNPQAFAPVASNQLQDSWRPEYPSLKTKNTRGTFMERRIRRRR